MKVLSFVLFFTVVISVFSFGRRETKHPLDGSFNTGLSTENSIIIRGSVRIYGNEPFTYIGIIDQNGLGYSVSPQSQVPVLTELQGYLIDFTVVLLDEPQGYGSLFLQGGTVTVLSWKIIE